MSSDSQTCSSESANQNKRKSLGILQAGRSPEEVLERYPDYNQLFIDLLGEDTFNYHTWAVLDNEFPESIHSADAWLVTGSRHGAYEPHDWIPPLEQLIRDIYAKGDPMVGICFGHQVIAQALGGKVEKFSGGWSIGRAKYTLDENVWGKTANAQTPLMAFHQDQVVELPPGAVNAGSSSFCQHAAVVYDSRILTIQPHPEFDSQFVDSLLQARSDTLPSDVVSLAKSTLHDPLDRDPIANKLRDFLNRPSPA